MFIVLPVTTMHEEVHRQTAEQKHEREVRHNMLAMVDNKIDSEEHSKSDQGPPYGNARRSVCIVFNHIIAYFLNSNYTSKPYTSRK